jgi:hypothetical protein
LGKDMQNPVKGRSKPQGDGNSIQNCHAGHASLWF